MKGSGKSLGMAIVGGTIIAVIGNIFPSVELLGILIAWVIFCVGFSLATKLYSPKICDKCGTALDEPYRYCTKCGKQAR